MPARPLSRRPPASLQWLFTQQGVNDVVTSVVGMTILHHAVKAVKKDSSHFQTLHEIVTHVKWHQARLDETGGEAFSLINQLTGADAHPPTYAPIHQACTNVYATGVEVVNLLLAARTNPNLRGFRGQTPVMMAAGTANSHALGVLLELQDTASSPLVVLETKDDDGRTVFDRFGKGPESPTQ